MRYQLLVSAMLLIAQECYAADMIGFYSALTEYSVGESVVGTGTEIDITSFSQTGGQWSCASTIGDGWAMALPCTTLPSNPPVCYEETTGVPLPGTINGMHVDLIWSGSGESIMEVPYDRSPANSSVPSRVRARLTGSNFVGASSTNFIYVCTFPMTNDLGLPAYFGTSSVEGSTYVQRIRHQIRQTGGFSATQPTTIRGMPGERLESTFTIFVPMINGISNSVDMSWNIGEPCSNWQPQLNGGQSSQPIDGNSDQEIILYYGNNNMTAFFTPTDVGTFSCTGNLIFNIP